MGGNGTRTGLGRVKERRTSARNRTISLDKLWETGEVCVERETHADKKVLVQ